MSDEIQVVVTHHAAARARQRGVSVETLKKDVRAAALAGRKAKAKPRWAWLPDHDASRGGGADRDGTFRYLWNKDEARAYFCAKTATGWRIITVLVNYDREAVA